MTAQNEFRRRMMALPDGGHVRGPGSGTSDSIHARLSDGEFVLPKDTVRKVGIKSLRDLVDMTHEPTDRREHPARFADGGLVDVRRQRPNSFGDAAAVASNPSVSLVGAPPVSAPAPAAPAGGLQGVADRLANLPSPSNTFPGNRLQGNSGFSGAPVGASPTAQAMRIPASAPAPAPAPSVSPSGLYMQDRGQEIRDQWGRGSYAQAAGTAARAAVQGLGMYGIEAADKLATPWVDAAKGFGQGAFGSGAEPASTPAPATAPAVPNPLDQRLAAGTQTTPAAAPPTAPSQGPSTGNVTRVGNSYSGTNVSGDITINGQAPRGAVTSLPAGASSSSAFAGVSPARPTSLWQIAGLPEGGISAQNMGAADALAARGQAESLGRLMASSQIAAPAAGPSLILSGNTGFRRDSRFLASELGAQRALDRVQFNDPASRRRAAELQRTSLQENAANVRAMFTAAAEAQRNRIAGERLAMDQTTAGYQNRSAQRLENAQVALENASTPEQRRAAYERLMAIGGKQPQNQYRLYVTPTTKNLDGSTTQGSVYRLNETAGDVQRVDAGQEAAAPMPSSRDAMVKGQVYQTARGPARWDGARFQTMQ